MTKFKQLPCQIPPTPFDFAVAADFMLKKPFDKEALASLVYQAQLNDKALREAQLYILELQNLVHIRESEIELLKEMLEKGETHAN